MQKTINNNVARLNLIQLCLAIANGSMGANKMPINDEKAPQRKPKQAAASYHQINPSDLEAANSDCQFASHKSFDSAL